MARRKGPGKLGRGRGRGGRGRSGPTGARGGGLFGMHRAGGAAGGGIGGGGGGGGAFTGTSASGEGRFTPTSPSINENLLPEGLTLQDVLQADPEGKPFGPGGLWDAPDRKSVV